jgi:hypothetical protein
VSTPFSNIYSKFTVLLKSFSLSTLDEETFNELINLWRDKASTLDFKACDKDLSDVNLVTEIFNETLTSEEQWIIAYSMLLTWVDYQIQDEYMLTPHFDTKDIKVSSIANHIDKLTKVQTKVEERFNKYLDSYKTSNFDLEED